MRRFCLLILLISFLFTIPAYPAEKVRIAIIDLQGKQVSKNMASGISDIIRSDLVDTGLFLVVERNQMNEILKEQGLQMTGCTDDACAVQVGKLLSANKMLVGEITRMGRSILITIRIVDVEKGVAEYSSKEKAKSEKELDKAASRLSMKLVGRITGKKKSELLAGLEERSMGGYYLRSIIPGWGQFYAGRPVKGFIYSGVFLLSVGIAYYAYSDYQKKDDAYHNLPYGSSEFDAKHDEFEQAGTYYSYSIVLVALVYALHWADVLYISKPEFGGETSYNSSNRSFLYFTMNRGPKILPEKRIGFTAGMRF